MSKAKVIRWGDVEPDDEQQELWRAWLAGRPANVRAVAERFDPWPMYRLAETGQRCRFTGIDTGAIPCGRTRCSETCALPSRHDGEHDPIGLITARIYAEHPTLGAITATHVFGIDPDSLVPWTEADDAMPIADDVTFALVATYTST